MVPEPWIKSKVFNPPPATMEKHYNAKKHFFYFLTCLLWTSFLTNTHSVFCQINVSDAHYCSPGKAVFTTSDAGCATYKWLDRQGVQLATGCTFTTPFIGLNQKYTVVSSSGVGGTVGYAYGAAGLTGLTNNTFTAVAAVQNSYITNFQINSTTALNTVDAVYTANSNFNCDHNVVLTLKDGVGTVIGTYSPLTVCGAGTKQNITINIGKTLAAGNYSITVTTPASFYDEGKPDMYTGGANYSIGGPLDYGFMRFTGNGAGGNAWGGLYNWNMSNTTTSKIITAIDDCSNEVCISVVAPLVNYDFSSGASNPGGAQPPGTNTYNYEATLNENSVGDGDYTIIRNNTGVTQNNTWHLVTQDHTGKPNGYYMMVNADYTPGIFYQSTVNGLCDGTFYVFSAAIMNLLKPTACGSAGITPDVKFTIKDLGGAVLQEFSTGDILPTSTPQWSVPSFNFFLPAGNNAVQLILSNTNPGGCGNDLLLDDILFSPCFPNFEVDDPGTTCASLNKTLNVNIPAGYSGALLQWEKSDDGGNNWTPVAGATSNQYVVENLTLAQNGQKYRLQLTSSLGGGLYGCPLKSKPATISVEDCSTLPVKFVDFHVTSNQANGADISWATAEEDNIDYYMIERSFDGVVFETIGFDSPRNQQTLNIYRHTDHESFNFVVYYRITAYDADGSFMRTGIKAKYPLNSSLPKLSVSPNPGKGIYTISFTQTSHEDQSVALSLTNMTGKQVLQEAIQLNSSSQSHVLNISSLASGIYILEVTDAKNSWTEKIIKE